MASVAQLNVEIGARIADLQKGLRGAERELRQSGAKMARIGADITSSLSVPLGLVGVSAITAAGDIESLTLALKSQLGSSEAAAKELDLLTEAARNPGLGVEQAVRGSVRLQGVGFAAAEARDVLIEMGNAIASTGGTAEDLDRVTRQFAQMTSKGRVLQEDISVIAESMPGLSGLMQKAFGTQNIEAIREMGVSGKEFVLQITKAAEAMPRVESGIKNSIGNAMDDLKQSAAKLGFAINDAFSVTGAIENFASFVMRMAEGFAALDPTIKTVILSVAGLAIAAGPALKVFGSLLSTGALLTSGLSVLAGQTGSLIGFVARLAIGFKTLDGGITRFRASLGVIGLVAGLAVAVYQLADNFDAAGFASEKYADAQKEIISETSKEIGVVNRLFAAVTDETKSKFEKGQSIDQLLKLYPDYFKGMDLEGASVSRLTELQNGLNSSILRGVAERKKAEAVNSIYEKQADILTRITQIRDSGDVTSSEATLINTGDMIREGSIAAAVIKKLEMQAGELTKQVKIVETQFDKTFGTIGTTLDPAIAKQYDLRDAYLAEKEAHEMGLTVTKKDTESREKNADAIEAQKKRLKALVEVLQDVKNAAPKALLIGDDADAAKLDALRKGIEKLVDAGFKPASKEVMDLKSQLDELTRKPNDVVIDVIQKSNGGGIVAPVSGIPAAPLPTISAPTGERELTAAEQLAAKIKEIQTDLIEGNVAFSDSFAAAAELVSQNGTMIQNAYMAIGGAIAEAAAGGAASFAQLAQAAVGAAAKVVRAWIQQGVAAAVAKALSSLPFPLNIAAGAAAGGLAAAAFTKAIGLIGVKKFAAGTRDAPGGLALVGERGPEMVNLPKHSQVFNAGVTSTALRGMGQGVHVTGQFRIQGSDMVAVVEKTQEKNLRFR